MTDPNFIIRLLLRNSGKQAERGRQMSKVYVVGLGPGADRQMTLGGKGGAGYMPGHRRLYGVCGSD